MLVKKISSEAKPPRSTLYGMTLIRHGFFICLMEIITVLPH